MPSAYPWLMMAPRRGVTGGAGAHRGRIPHHIAKARVRAGPGVERSLAAKFIALGSYSQDRPVDNTPFRPPHLIQRGKSPNGLTTNGCRVLQLHPNQWAPLASTPVRAAGVEAELHSLPQHFVDFVPRPGNPLGAHAPRVCDLAGPLMWANPHSLRVTQCSGYRRGC